MFAILIFLRMGKEEQAMTDLFGQRYVD